MIRYHDRSVSDTTHYIAIAGEVDKDGTRTGYRFQIPRADRADRQKVWDGDARRKLNKRTFRYRMKRQVIEPLTDKINSRIKQMKEDAFLRDSDDDSIRSSSHSHSSNSDSDDNSRNRSRSRSRSRSRTPNQVSDGQIDENDTERYASQEEQNEEFKPRTFRFKKKKKRVSFANKGISNQNEVKNNSEDQNEDRINFDDPLRNLRRNTGNLRRDELLNENKKLTK